MGKKEPEEEQMRCWLRALGFSGGAGAVTVRISDLAGRCTRGSSEQSVELAVAPGAKVKDSGRRKGEVLSGKPAPRSQMPLLGGWGGSFPDRW